VLLSEHTVTDCQSTVCYIRSVCTTLLLIHNLLLSEYTVTGRHSTVFMCVQCAQHYCNTQCVAIRTHSYRPSDYYLLFKFSVHIITLTHNVLLSEHSVTDRQSTICYIRSVCTTNFLFTDLELTRSNWIYNHTLYFIQLKLGYIFHTNFHHKITTRTMTLSGCDAMHVKYVNIKYTHCYISLYSKTTSENRCNKIKITNIPLYFIMQQQFFQDIIKAELKFIYLT
jgi:hypothetical protein